MAEADLSRIVSLIMENPKLIEEIKNLGSKGEPSERTESSVQDTPTDAVSAPSVETVASIDSGRSASRARRGELLSALKPYVSEERRRAIDSMMSIADILDMMRAPK